MTTIPEIRAILAQPGRVYDTELQTALGGFLACVEATFERVYPNVDESLKGEIVGLGVDTSAGCEAPVEEVSPVEPPTRTITVRQAMAHPTMAGMFVGDDEISYITDLKNNNSYKINYRNGNISLVGGEMFITLKKPISLTPTAPATPPAPLPKLTPAQKRALLAAIPRQKDGQLIVVVASKAAKADGMTNTAQYRVISDMMFMRPRLLVRIDLGVFALTPAGIQAREALQAGV